MATGYHHLSYEERCQIHALRKRADSLREIARQLGRSPSTISRELHRNSGGRGYRYQQATRLASGRRRKASLRPRKMTEAMWSLVREKLALYWSPEQVSGRLRRDGVVSVSTTWIYRHSWADRAVESTGGALLPLGARFRPPLIKPDMQNYRIRLSDKIMFSPTEGPWSLAQGISSHTSCIALRVGSAPTPRTEPCACDRATGESASSCVHLCLHRRD